MFERKEHTQIDVHLHTKFFKSLTEDICIDLRERVRERERNIRETSVSCLLYAP